MTTTRKTRKGRKGQAEPRYAGFTVEELKRAFEHVEDYDDWRNPIDAWVTEAMFLVTSAAVEFYTGTKLRIVDKAVLKRANGDGLSTYRVQADGYRKGPAGDH